MHNILTSIFSLVNKALTISISPFSTAKNNGVLLKQTIKAPFNYFLLNVV